MFEVGKKYRRRNVNDTATAVFATGLEIVLQWGKGGYLFILRNDERLIEANGWYEYHEPVIVEKYLNVYPSGGIAAHSSREAAERDAVSNRVGTLKLTLTDGKLTDVRILEN